MSYGIVRVEKFKAGDVKGIEIHDRRNKDHSHTNKEIDYNRTKFNYALHEVEGTFRQNIKKRIAQLNLKKAVRKDAVVMAQVLVTSDRSFFDRLSPEQTKAFFEQSYAFLADRYGRENIISAIVHMDEKTPHMHFNFVPATEDGRLSAKLILNRTDLIKQHDDFYKQIGREWGLSRGEKEGYKKHLSVIDYKIATAAGALEQTEQSLEFGKKLVRQERTELDQLRAENQILKSENAALKVENNKSKKQLETVQQELTDVKLAYDEMMAAGVEEYQKFKALENKNELLEGRCSDLEKQIDEKVSKANKIIDQANRLESESEGQKLVISHLANQMREYSEELEKVKVELSDTQNIVSEVHTQENMAQFRLEHLKAEEKRLNGKIRDLKYAESRFPDEIRNLGQKKSELESDLKILSGEKSELEREIRNFKTEIEKRYRFKSDRDNIVAMVSSFQAACNRAIVQIEQQYSLSKVYIPTSLLEWSNKKPGLFKDNDRIHAAVNEVDQLNQQQKKQDDEKEQRINGIGRLAQEVSRQAESVINAGDRFDDQEIDIWDQER